MIGSNLVLENTNLKNNGTLDAQAGTVILSGNSYNATIDGTPTTTNLNNLQIDKTSMTVSLAIDISIESEMEMISGFFDLGNNNLTLGTTSGTIVGETSSTYITASNDGEIIKTISLNQPSAESPGNMGVEITSAQNLGSTTIRRGHAAKTVGNYSSIERYYSIEPTNNSGLDATVKLYYQDHELNSLTEADLEMYEGESDNWVHLSTNSSDVSSNYIEVTSLDSLNDYTLSKGLIKLGLKALLTGAYNASGLMYDDLRTANLLPNDEPYTALGFSHSGDETIVNGVFDVTGNDAIVDWVYIELRDETTPSTIVATRAALIQKDGDIVDIDGKSNVTFDISAGNYFVVVKHRNHLGVMSASVLALSTTETTYDFTASLSNTEGAANGINDLTGYYGLFSGDMDFNGQVQNSDITPILLIIGTAGYLTEDADMNGQVQNSDIQNNLQPYMGKGEQY
jgi:hypothetical protein